MNGNVKKVTALKHAGKLRKKAQRKLLGLVVKSDPKTAKTANSAAYKKAVDSLPRNDSPFRAGEFIGYINECPPLFPYRSTEHGTPRFHRPG